VHREPVPADERSTVKATHYRWDDMPKEALKPDLHRRLISTDRMMLAHVYLDEGAVVPKHAHENEQLTYILEGTLRFWLGDNESEVVDVHAGEVLHIPSNLPHKAEALEQTLDVTFSARRARTGSTARTPTSAGSLG
jgi:quercetin dioxygenase-like cupin family protein